MTGVEANALEVRDGKIAAIGSTENLKARAAASANIIDLNGKTLMPAFIDAHMHIVHVGLNHSGFSIDLSEVRSLQDALELIRDVVTKRGDGEWIRGRGWDEMNWPEKRYITKTELDKIAPRNPVSLTRIDGHLLVANSSALKEVRISVGSDEFDQELGILREKGVVEFNSQTGPNKHDVEAAILATTELAHSLGMTAVHDYVSPSYIRAYQDLKKRGDLELRVTMHPFVENLDLLRDLGMQTGFGDEFLKLGAIKLFSDGSIGARNAALFEPYIDTSEDDRTTGKLNYEQDELNALTRQAHNCGFQISIHAIGDRAIGATLDAMIKAGVQESDRSRVEHLELPTEEQLQQMHKHGIIACMQPNFVQWSGPESLYEVRLGAERDALMDPHRRILEHGVKLAFGSDGMPFNPLFGIHSVVNAPHENQRLSVDEALRAYTIDAAHIGFDEDILGSLEVGKRADLVVLSENPHDVPDKIADIEVLETYLCGECVYTKGETE